MASFHWVANCQIKVGKGTRREEGEYVPEADEWRDPEMWERAQHIRKVPGPPPGMPGGDGCHVHDMHNGKCSSCEFMEPVIESESKPPDPDLPTMEEAKAARVVEEFLNQPDIEVVEARDAGISVAEAEVQAQSNDQPTVEVPTMEEVLTAGYSPEAAKFIIERQKKRAAGIQLEPSVPDSIEDSVAEEILAAVSKTFTEPPPGQESPSGPVQEPNPQPEPETEQEPATMSITDSGSEPKLGDDEREEKESHTKSELMRMRKADLQDLALEWDLVVGEATKAQIITAILDAQEE